MYFPFSAGVSKINEVYMLVGHVTTLTPLYTRHDHFPLLCPYVCGGEFSFKSFGTGKAVPLSCTSRGKEKKVVCQENTIDRRGYATGGAAHSHIRKGVLSWFSIHKPRYEHARSHSSCAFCGAHQCICVRACVHAGARLNLRVGHAFLHEWEQRARGCACVHAVLTPPCK